MTRSDLPADSHVHSEYSWDTGGPASRAAGTMRATCERAVRIGLPALFFTEHLDLEPAWLGDPEDFAEDAAVYRAQGHRLLGEDGVVDVPRFDVDGYFESIERCRAEFPELRIGTGLEFGQPHLRTEAAAQQLDLDRFDRIIGSLHTLPADAPSQLGDDASADGGSADGGSADDAPRAEPDLLFRRWPADEVVRHYLAHVPALVAGDEPFEIVTHIDYALRYWPEADAGPFDPLDFEEEFRGAMRAIANSGRALEMNTRRLWPWVPRWWAESGGQRISFGSDSHTTATLAHGFPEAMEMVEAFGFRRQRRPEDLWVR